MWFLLATGVLLGLLSAGCDEPSSPNDSAKDAELAERRQEFYRERAAKMGSYHARRVRLVAEDMAKLDPRSERSEASREAKELLDTLVPRETQQ